MGACRRPRAPQGVLSALGVLALGISSARAAEPSIPPDCGTRAAFDAQLRQRLGDATPTSSVRVDITPSADHYHLRVQIGAEVRELDDASCSELFRASIVVAVAMLLHDEPPARATTPPPSPPPSKPTPHREYPQLTLGAGAGLNVGTLPQPVLALELESKALWRAWGVTVNARYFSQADKLHEQNKGVSLHAFGAGAAGLFRPSRLWEARLGFAVQNLVGEGTSGLAVRQRASAWAAGPTLGLAAIPFQTELLWAGLGAEAQLNALRGRFEILNYSGVLSTDPYPAYTVPWLAGSAFVRLGLVW